MMFNIIPVILVGISMLAAGWFAGPTLSTKQAQSPTPTATSTTETAIKEVIKEIVKEVPVIKDRIVVQDISQAKINEYESRVSALKNKLDQTYREIRDSSDPVGYVIRLYPHGGDQPEDLNRIAIYETNGSKNSGMAVRMLKQEYDAQAGYTTIASTTYSVDINSFINNLNIALEKDSSGKIKYYYKFYAVLDGISKFLFSFPTKQ